MTRDRAYALFEEMIIDAEKDLFDFTLNSKLDIEHKADKSAVTKCDKQIDENLTKLAHRHGLKVISEESEHVIDIVKSGNYMTIDPIDGTLGYIEHVNHALNSGGIKNFLNKDLGSASDFCLLLGIVENNQPRFGACYNFVTKEKILIDSEDSASMIRVNNQRNFKAINAVYVDQRPGDYLETELLLTDNITVFKQATLGLKSLYTVLNGHLNSITCHRVQSAGLWDIMPATVAAKAFDCEVFDDLGNPLLLNKYIILPGKGATIIRGEKFRFIVDKLKQQS
jgi:fructose-1,6-bisphosphatase/inositol monophosphatase family enzyme